MPVNRFDVAVGTGFTGCRQLGDRILIRQLKSVAREERKSKLSCMTVNHVSGSGRRPSLVMVMHTDTGSGRRDEAFSLAALCVSVPSDVQSLRFGQLAVSAPDLFEVLRRNTALAISGERE